MSRAPKRPLAVVLMHANDPIKTCGLCRTEKPRSAFNRCAKNIDGLSYWCRECNKLQKRAWHAKHKAAQNAASKEYSRHHAARIRENRIKRDSQNYAQRREYTLKYQARNAERLRRARLIRNATKKPWRAWRRANPEKSREQCRRQQAQRWFSATVKKVSYDAIYEREKGICYLCCQPVGRKRAHFDHVIPLSKGGSHTFDNIRPTHPSCNLRKAFNLIEPGAFA